MIGTIWKVLFMIILTVKGSVRITEFKVKVHNPELGVETSLIFYDIKYDQEHFTEIFEFSISFRGDPNELFSEMTNDDKVLIPFVKFEDNLLKIKIVGPQEEIKFNKYVNPKINCLVTFRIDGASGTYEVRPHNIRNEPHVESFVGQSHPLEVELKLVVDIPENGVIIISPVICGPSPLNTCSNIFSICDVRGTAFNIYEFDCQYNLIGQVTITTSRSIPSGATLVLKFLNVQYGDNMTPREIVIVTMQGINYNCGRDRTIATYTDTTKWFPQAISKFESFSFTSSQVETCKIARFIWTVRSAALIEEGSGIKIFFTSKIIYNGVNDPEKFTTDDRGKIFTGKLFNVCYKDSNCVIIMTAVTLPNIETTFSNTLKVFDANGNQLFKESSESIAIRPAKYTKEVTSNSNDEVNFIVGKPNKFIIAIKSHCGVIRPASCYISQPKYFTITSGDCYNINELDSSDYDITLELINPSSAKSVSDEKFVITVKSGNKIAFTVDVTLSSNIKIVPEKFTLFDVKALNSKPGEIDDYKLRIYITHKIPPGGKLKLIFNELMEWQTNSDVLFEGLNKPTDYVFSYKGNNVIVIEFHVEVSGCHTITLKNIKNPSMTGSHKGFYAESKDSFGDKIETSEGIDPEIIIDIPEDEIVSCSLRDGTNYIVTEWKCDFETSINIPYPPNTDNTLKITIPPEVTCTSSTNIAIPSSSIPTNKLEVTLECTNPQTIKPIKGIGFILVAEDNTRQIFKGTGTITTTKGTPLESCRVECNPDYPDVDAICSVSFEKSNPHRISRIEIKNNKLVAGGTCTATGINRCTMKDGTIKVYYGNAIDNQFIISNIPLRTPDFNSPSDSIFTVKTKYNDNGKLYTVDEDNTACSLIIKCKHPCAECKEDSPTECTKCIQDTTLYLYENLNQCLPLESNNECKEGYFKQDTNCLECDKTKCVDCIEHKDNCILCHTSNPYLYEGKCYTECEDGTYATSNTCYKCPDKCDKCLSDTICTECRSGYFLDNISCGTSCPDGTYPSSNDKKCMDCDARCETCSSRDICLNCKDEHYLKEGKCETKSMCTAGNEYIADDTRKECVKCAYPCKECIGDINTCIACVNNLVYFDGHCINDCPDTYFKDEGRCYKCSNNCGNCVGNKIGDCINCEINYLFVIDQGICRRECPNGYYRVNDICERCSSDANCNTCYGTAFHCTSCSGNYELKDNNCILKCKVGSYLFAGVCYDCHESCHTCEHNARNCIVCSSSHPFVNGFECMQRCAEGMVGIRNKCEHCNPPCANCEGTQDTCISCIGNNYLFDNTCISICPKNTVYSQKGRYCIPCKKDCERCSWADSSEINPSICTECTAEHVLFNHECRSHCPPGYNKSNDGRTCISDGSLLTDEVDYLPFPHLIAAGFLSFIIIIGQARDSRALVLSNLAVIVNYVGMCCYVLQGLFGYMEEKTLIFLVTGGVVLGQLLLNILFCIPYNRSIAPDVGFIQWKRTHCLAKTLIMLCCTVVTLQTMRLLYSRLLGFSVFFVVFKDYNNLLSPLNSFSLFQIILHLIIVALDIYALLVLSLGNYLYIFIIESLILSVLLLILIAYEMKDGFKGELEKQSGKYSELHNQSNTLGEDKIHKEIYDSLLKKIEVKQRSLSNEFTKEKPKRRHGFSGEIHYEKESDPRRLNSYPCSPRIAKNKEIPLKKYGYDENKIIPPDELPDNVYSESVPARNLNKLKKRKNFGAQTHPFQKLDIFRKHMGIYGQRKKKLFVNTAAVLKSIPKSLRQEEDEKRAMGSHKLDISSTVTHKDTNKISLAEANKSNSPEILKQPSSRPQPTEDNLLVEVSEPPNPMDKETSKNLKVIPELSKKKNQRILNPVTMIPQ